MNTKSLIVFFFIISSLFNIMQAQISKEEIINSLNAANSNGGVDSVIFTIHKFYNEYPDSLSMMVSATVQVAAGLFQHNDRKNAIKMLEMSKGLFTDEINIYAVLGQFYWYENQRDSCINNFKKCLIINPKYSLAKKYLDLVFFVQEDFKVPELFLIDHMRIRPIFESDAELDYKAIMSSINHIRGVFGPDDDWPKDDLTFEDDIIALKNHEEEFRRRSAFTYTVMDPDEKECLGCVYILPIHVQSYDAQIFFWVTSKAFEKGYDEELYIGLKKWLKEKWPFINVIFPGRDMDWNTYNQIQE